MGAELPGQRPSIDWMAPSPEITEDVMFEWRLLVEDGRKSDHTFSQPDVIIAATALHHGLTIVSRHETDHRRANAAVFNPWTAALPRPKRG